MIVVDASVLVAYLLPSAHAHELDRLFLRDSEWIVPALWRSELANVLVSQVRFRQLPVAEATAVFASAVTIVARNEYRIDHAPVIALAAARGLSAYDAEYLHLAREMAVPLVTLDRKLQQADPHVAMSPQAFLDVPA